MNGAQRHRMGNTTLTTILSSVVLLASVTIAADNGNSPPGFHLTMLSRACDHFAIKVYKLLAGNDDNVLFSPLSVLSALSMTYMGGNQKTASQLKHALQMKLMHRNEILQSFKQLEREIQSDKNVNVSQENGIFASKEFPFEQKTMKEITESFGARIRNLDFRNGQGAEWEINNFVKNLTRGRIPELLPPNSVTSSNALYLVNALYFKASWLHTFSLTATRIMDFYVTPTTTKKTEMMNQNGEFRCVTVLNLKSTILELPFLGDRFALYILLPDAMDGLTELKKRLTYQRLESLFRRLQHPYPVDVTLPRFSLTRTMDMKSVLRRLGLKDMFSKRRADFSRLDKTRSLFVDKLQQQAVLTIDELGAEGAAATAVGFMSRSRPEIFTADHPFIFILRDTRVGVSLFMGQYMRPEPVLDRLRRQTYSEESAAKDKTSFN
ncbi:leukocyte elastase inhibitor-like isoform X2 [Gigantopelta aegis]|uniref:leukocyte elastase inhibitor-like isoform X2 n=1 Tax=Gigantopelta aegis TaxID=1735272 RepID=UPI001B88C848|nr:leukocyte elastase inhibitor-like isoform X2 [Gigantopelta aegis]